MATEEEAREATDGQEVQVEAATDLQAQLDSKLSSIKEIKGEAQTMGSTEGILKIPEDEVLVEAPSETKIPSEHSLNGTASSLNGHVNKEENISNEQPHEINQESQEQVETSSDGTSTYPSNKSNEEEMTDSLSHGESASEDTTILKCENAEAKDHGQQDVEGHVTNDTMVQEEICKTDDAIEQTVDAQDLDSSKESKEAQPAIMTDIPADEVLAEAPAGIQSPLEPNVGDSDTVPGNKETDDPAKEDDTAYLDHKESFPEDKVIAEHADEEVKAEDQQSKQADDMDAEVLQEEIPESKESDLPETEQAEEASVDDQEALNQQPALETNDSLSVKAEETCHQSNVATCGEKTPEDDATTREPTVDTKEEQNQGSVEEMKDAEAVDTEETVQQSSVAFDEAIQDHAATTNPSSDIQSIEPEETKGPSDVKAEEVSSQSNVAFAEDAVQDKVIPSEPPEDIRPVKKLEQEETKEADEASNETNSAIFSDLNQEDSIVASKQLETELAEEAAAFSNLDQEGGIADSESQVADLEEAKEIEATETEEITHQPPAAVSTELPKEDNSTRSEPHNDDIQHSLEQDSIEVKDTEAAEIQEISQERTIATSKEDAVEDDGTAEGPTCVSQEVQDVESEEVKDTEPDNVVEASDVVTVDDEGQENNVLTSENIAELQLQGLESEEIKSPEPIETEAGFHTSHAAPSNDPVEVNTTACETQDTESAEEIKETEGTKTESIPQESNISVSEESNPEDSITASETISNTQELTIAGSIEASEDNIDTKTGEITDQSNEVFAGEAAQGDNIPESVSTADTQSMQELESEEMKKPELVDLSGTFHQKDDAISQKQNQEDNPTTCETNEIGSTEVSSVEASEDQAIAHQSNITQCEEQATEESITESEPQILEIESVQDMEDTEATEPELVSEQNIVSTSEESVPEENATTEEPAFHDREIQNDGAELTEQHDSVKAEELPNQSSGAIVEETAQEADLVAGEPIDDVQEKDLEPEEISNTVDGETGEASHQTHAAVEDNWTGEVESSVEASEDQAIAHQSNITQCEEQATEESLTESEPQILEMESVQDIKDTEATESETIFQKNIVPTSEESVPEENATAKEPAFDDREIQNDGAELTKEHDGVKDEEIPDQSSGAIVEETAQEANLLASEPTDDVQVKELEPEEISNTVDGETEEASCQTHEVEMTESSEQMKDTEPPVPEPESSEEMRDTAPTVPEPTLQDSRVASVEEIETHNNATIEQNVGYQQLQEQESVEFKETEVLEPQGVIPSHNVSSSEEFNPQETVTKEEPGSDTQAEESPVVIEDTEDVNNSAALSEKIAPEEHVLATETTVDTPPVQETELEERQNIESVEAEDNIAASGLPGEEIDTEAIEIESVPHESTTTSVKELNEDVKSNVALAEEAASEEHILETEVTVDKSSAQEPELEEIKNTEPAEQEHNITETGLPEEEMKDNEAMETETVPHDSNIESIKELREDDIITASALDVYTQQIPEQESVEDMKCTDTTEHPGETPESIVSTSDELTKTGEITTVKEATFDTQQAQSFTDQETDLSSSSNPEEAVQESDLVKSEQETDVQQEQELDSTEETKGTEDYQQNGVSTCEESVTEVEPNVDDQHVQENKSAVEVKENEDTETEEISKQINFTTSENGAQESSEQEADQPFYVQPVQQLELTTDSKDNQLVEAEETSSQSNIVTPEDPTAEDRVAYEIDPSVDIDQGHELELVEEVKDTDAIEAEETSHAGQAVSSAEKFSESNLSAVELTHGIQQVHYLETMEEMKGTEGTCDEEICYEQTATSEDPSPTDNGKSLQDYHVESNEENLGNGIGDVISVHEKIEDNIHESAELKDETSELGEKTQISANRIEENDDHISTEDTEETSNNTNLVKEGPNEHGSSQTSNVQDNKQLHDVGLQTQVRERSVDIGQQDEDMKNVNLDQQQKEDEEIEKQKEDEEIEKQKEELQTDEQKHDDKRVDFIIDTQVESIDAFQAEQTDSVVTEMLNDEVTQHEPEDSIPRTTDAMVENITEIKEETEEENGPNSGGTLEVSAKNYNEDVHENTEKDAVVEKTSSSEHDEIAGEIRNEEVEPCLASSLERDLQVDSDLSNDQMLENNPIAVPQNDEYMYRAEEGYTNKVNVDMHAIQESDKVIEDAEEKQGMQNEDNVVHHDESLVTTQKEEASQVHTDEQYSADTKMDDTAISYAEMTHENTSTEPREVEDTKEKKGFNDFPEFVVETSKQDDVDQDFSIHHQVEDEKSAETENNSAESEAVQPKLDITIAETNNDNNLSTINPLPEHETENASDINQNRQYQEATNEDAIDNIETGRVEKMETSYTATTEVVTLNEDICDKASGADGVPPDGSLKTSEDNLDVSSVVTESEGENINKETEDHKLALPVHPTQDENTTEQGFGLEDTEKESMSPEKALPAEPEEQEENQVTKEQDEEDRHDAELGDAHEEDHKEAEQDYLPVSSFLMNLILGKDNDDPKKDSETEVEKEQEETTKDGSCLIASQQEENLVAFPIEKSVDEKLTFEQEKEKVEGSEETKEPVKEQSYDVEMDVQKSLETDEELKRNTCDLEAPVYQDNAQDEISSKLISAKAADPIKKMEARDFELDEESFDTVCQENVEAATEIEDGSLNRDQDDITSPKASQEDALEEVGTELPHESLHENRHGAKDEQTLSLIEPDTGNAEKLPNEADSVQSPPCTEQEESIESSYVEVRSTTEGQVESEVIETNEEDQHTTAGGHTEEQIENLHDDKSKETCSEEISDEQAPEITEPVSHTDRNFAYEKEIPASSTCMDKKESMISNNEVSNFEKALETHSDSPNLHVNQDKKDETADNQTVVDHNTVLDKLEDSNRQEEQETAAQKLPKETEGNQEFMAITEPVIKEENVHETVEGNTQAVKIKSNEEKELFDSQVQERGLNVVSPKATSEADEKFVEITKPEFSTDEEHSPKADESNKPDENTCDEKTKAEEETNNITDEATVKIEERGAEQKVSHKKHNILSGVGSKVKHQLAKVKKAIIGKPGHTKSESPKS
ncbi:uncharacterized protein [Oryza sativa Japonica Group]|jgi:hypothetical protein|uniref:uncharacterized protein n=1 Tax=Oryza sativa subsp. japonica TaxID=39947 RepID=UPI0007755C2B|nr:titin homolog [Oryza sativa Japonica Group]KAF2942875.1 hypothetical protein DAI22_02g025800 [Oryza sativa Japonica Group]